MEQCNINAKLMQTLNEEDNFPVACRDIAAGIKERHSRLVELVEGLHDALTNTNPNVREKGVRILTHVLQLLPQDFLTDTELNFILRFLADRLKDHHSVVPPALQGILCVLQMKHVPSKLPDYLLPEMGQHISCQAQLQNDRYTVYNIISQLAMKYPNDLKQLGPDFIYQVISNIDGEKDPRNLMFLFRMMPDFLKKFALGHLAEDMFDVFSCYFPVDFYSATNNPSSITREQLASALAVCLTAVPEFSEFCFPLIFEKLESTRKEAKLDCFYLLKIGFSNFPVANIEKYLPALWANIKAEALLGIDKEIREAAVEALCALLYSLSVSPLDKDHANLLTQVVQAVITDTRPSLNEVEMNAFLPSAQLLLRVAEASVPSCIQVITNVVPILQTLYYRNSGAGQRAIVLQTISNFLRVCDIKGIITEETQELQQVLKESHSLYLDAAMMENEDILREAIHGLAIVIPTLDGNSRCKLYEILAACLKQQKKKKIRQESITCFKKLARMYSDEVMNTMVSSKLQVFEGGGDGNFDETYECCQLALCEIADTEPFTSFIVPKFLDLVVGSHNFKKHFVGVTCLRKLVELPGNDTRIHNLLYEQCSAVTALVSWCFKKVQEEELVDSMDCIEFLTLIAKVLECIVRKQTLSVQSSVMSQFVPWFLHPELYFKNGKSIMPLNPASPASHTQLVMLFEGLLSSVRQDVNLQNREELIYTLTVLAVETSHAHSQRSASRLVGNLINKAPNDETLSKCLITISQQVAQGIASDSSNLMKKHNSVQLLIWVTKALVMRGHKDAGNWISSLIDTLHDDSISADAANGFELIVKENEEYFSKDSFCNIRLLFRQHLFVLAQEKLVKSHHSAITVTAKCNHLLSLVHILKAVPRQVLLTELPQVIPLLLESLKQQHVSLLLSTLGTIFTLLEERQREIIDYLNTFISTFLLLSQFEQSMRVRVLALQCLYQLCFYPTESILPYKDQVVRELSKSLDDKKRLVRLQAVRARSRWFVVGSPGEPDKS